MLQIKVFDILADFYIFILVALCRLSVCVAHAGEPRLYHHVIVFANTAFQLAFALQR